MHRKGTKYPATALPAEAGLAFTAVLLALSLCLLAGLAYAQSGSISGTVTYYGGITGTHEIAVGARLGSPSGPRVAGIRIPGPGSFTLGSLEDGTYYVGVHLDADDSGGPPADWEPWAWYDPDRDGQPDPVVISGGQAVTGVDIAIGGPWLPLGGPTIAGGQVHALAVHPAMPGTLYAAVQSPGTDWDLPAYLFKSTNGAANWTPVYTASNRVVSLATGGSIVYAGGYTRDDLDPRPLIYRSDDSGVTWTDVLSLTEGTIWDLDVHPTLPQVALAGGGDFPDRAILYHTDDGGMSWTEVFSYVKPEGYKAVNAVLIHPTMPLTWLISHDGEVNGMSGSYIVRSTDGGASWTRVHTITGDIVSNLVPDPGTATTLYASTRQDNFYRSTDGGASWTAIVTDGSAGEHLVLDPPNTLYAADGHELRRSTNGGENWTPIFTFFASPQALSIDLGPTPSALYVVQGVSAGVYKSTDNGVTWLERNNGKEVVVLPQDIEPDPQDPARLLVAAGSGGGWLTTDGGDSWVRPSGLSFNMRAFAVNPVQPEVVYGSASQCRTGSVQRSGNGGLSFTTVYTAPFIVPDGSGGCETLNSTAIAPSNTDTVYAAGWNSASGEDDQAVILRSLDDGDSWAEVFTLPPRSSVQALAIDPTDEDVVYAGGEDCSGASGSGCVGFFYRTTDGGEQWDLALVSTDTIRSIVIDHQQPGVLYVSDDGYWVRKSTDGGDNWMVVREAWWVSGEPSGNLLAIDPNAAKHVYLAGWGYIAETVDGGETWSGGDDPLNTNTPEMGPSALAADYGTVTQIVYAGFTGVWAHRRQGPPPMRVYLPVVLKNR